MSSLQYSLFEEIPAAIFSSKGYRLICDCGSFSCLICSRRALWRHQFHSNPAYRLEPGKAETGETCDCYEPTCLACVSRYVRNHYLEAKRPKAPHVLNLRAQQGDWDTRVPEDADWNLDD
jgi:hypothetical protein